MPFRIALSGLNAAQTDLSVTANNIANTSTNGFKGSRAEFADLFAVSLQGVSSNATGNGVRVAAVSQQFAQGNIEFTDSNLDLAISGSGMFIVSDGGALAYTRAGAYQLNHDGFVVNSSFPGRMDWETGAPKANRLDGWIVLGNGSYTSTLKVWALCVPAASIPVQQVDLDN